MKYVEFKNGIDNGKEYPVYLFEGEDAFFRERGLSLLKEKFVSEPSLNYVVLDSDVGVGDLIASLNGYPFLSQKKLTLVREFYPKADYFKKGLKEYLDNPSNLNLLVIINEKPCESIKKYKSVCVVECSKADVALIIRWIRGECNKAGVLIDGETAGKISEYCLGDMTRIDNEIKKLISYVGKGGQITAQIVEDLVSRATEYKMYEMTNYIAKKQFDKAIEVVHDLMSKGETAHMVVAYVYSYFRRLLHSAISGKSVSELSQIFSLPEYAVKKTVEQSAKFKKKSLKNAVDLLTDTDYKIKSGLVDADDRFYYSLFKIITENQVV